MAAIRIKLPGRSEISVVVLREGRITFGRSRRNTVQILDPSVSMHHAEFVKSGERLELRDSGSTNGVFVDGRRVSDCFLQDSCLITLGSYQFEYVSQLSQDQKHPVETLSRRSELDALDAECLKLKQAIAQREGESERLRAELRSAKSEAGTIQMSCEELKAALASSPNVEELHSLKADRDQLRAELQEKGREFDRLYANQKQLQEVRDELNRQLASLPKQEALKSLHKEIESLETKLREKDQTLDRVRRERNHLEQTRADLSEKLAAAPESEAMESLRSENERLKRALSEKATEFDGLQKESEEVGEDLQARHEAALAELQEHCEELDQQLRLREEELAALIREWSEVNPNDPPHTRVSPLPLSLEQKIVPSDTNASKELEDLFGEIGLTIRPMNRSAPFKNGK